MAFALTSCDDPEAVRQCETDLLSVLISPASYKRLDHSTQEKWASISYDAENFNGALVRGQWECYQKDGVDFTIERRDPSALNLKLRLRQKELMCYSQQRNANVDRYWEVDECVGKFVDGLL